ncbi:hypothetical protein HPULCUR_004228 [Helicostylum pulchrum]|uniref:DDE Tnp4 domain-containing protein n=1 Tax=Helicostylum pulchrum TaxID=562976 RepID=A0ABP9XVK6_9FUNG
MSTYAELFLQQLAITYEDSMLLTNTCSAAVYSYFTENELESSTHDAAAFKWTEVFTVFLRHPQIFFSYEGYILADSSYALSRNVIVPYPITETTGNSPDAIAKRRFSKVHSSARMTVERAFGLLSARWRFISKHVYMRDITDVCYVITAACILHNICINIDDPDFDFRIPNEIGSVEEEGEDEGENENEDNIPRSVRMRRNELNRWFSTQ